MISLRRETSLFDLLKTDSRKSIHHPLLIRCQEADKMLLQFVTCTKSSDISHPKLIVLYKSLLNIRMQFHNTYMKVLVIPVLGMLGSAQTGGAPALQGQHCWRLWVEILQWVLEFVGDFYTSKNFCNEHPLPT